LQGSAQHAAASNITNVAFLSNAALLAPSYDLITAYSSHLLSAIPHQVSLLELDATLNLLHPLLRPGGFLALYASPHLLHRTSFAAWYETLGTDLDKDTDTTSTPTELETPTELKTPTELGRVAKVDRTTFVRLAASTPRGKRRGGVSGREKDGPVLPPFVFRKVSQRSPKSAPPVNLGKVSPRSPKSGSPVSSTRISGNATGKANRGSSALPTAANVESGMSQSKSGASVNLGDGGIPRRIGT